MGRLHPWQAGVDLTLGVRRAIRQADVLGLPISAFEDDRATDLALRALGYQVVRLADRQLEGEPGRIADFLREVAA